MVKKRTRQNGFTQKSEKKTQKLAPVDETVAPVDKSQLSSSTLWLWGSNCFGQLGFGADIMEKIRPTQSSFGEKILDVAVGGMHTLMLLEDETLWSFGVNDEGALGRETNATESVEEDSTKPGIVTLPPESAKPIQLACTDSASFVLTKEGSIYGCGTFRNEHGVFGFTPSIDTQTTLCCVYKSSYQDTPAIKISAGGNHIVAILKNGDVLSWGDGSQGQLGRIGLRNSLRDDTAKKTMLTPGKIEGFKKVKFIDAYCGEYTTFLKASDDQFYATGLNNSGQLAMQPAEDVSNEVTLTMEGRVQNKVTFLVPTLVEAFKACDINEIAAGKDHALGLNPQGELYSWGVPTYGILGRDQMISKVEESIPFPKPEHVSKIDKKVTAIAVGQVISGCIDEEGQLYTWGACLNDMLGLSTDDDILLPRKVPHTKSMKNKKFCKLAFGGQHVALLGK